MTTTTKFRAEDATVQSGRFPVEEFIVYKGDPDEYPVLQVVDEVDGFYILENHERRFVRPVVTVDRDFEVLWEAGS